MDKNYFSFEDNSPGTLQGSKYKSFFFPVGGANVSEIIDNYGNDVTTSALSDSADVPAGTLLEAGEGKYYRSITGSAGGVNFEVA